MNILDAYNEVIESWDNRFGQGLDGYLENIVETANGSLESVINKVSNNSLSKEIKDQIKHYIQTDQPDKAAELIPNSPFDQSTLTVMFSKLDTNLAGQVQVDNSGSIFPEAYQIGSDAESWSGSNTQNYNFSYVSSYEELISELRSIKRDITTLVVHWTDTFSNKNLTAQQIHDMHSAVGMNGIGYHYIIRKDGTLQRGRPADQNGEHTLKFNDRTLAIAFVAGYTCPTGTPNPELYQSVESITRAQFTTFDMFLSVYYQYFQGGQVVGHRDLELVPDPGFDVQNYCRNRFGKSSIYTPGTQRILTRTEINAKREISNANVRKYNLE